MKCTHCGNALDAQMRFCDECGAPVDAPGPGPGRAPRTVMIGREADNDIPIPAHQTQVGRRHAVIHIEESGLFIDIVKPKTNETWVNGVPISGRTPIRMEDEIRFGSFLFNTALLQPFLHGDHRPPPPSPYDFAAPVPPPPIVIPGHTGMPAWQILVIVWVAAAIGVVVFLLATKG